MEEPNSWKKSTETYLNNMFGGGSIEKVEIDYENNKLFIYRKHDHPLLNYPMSSTYSRDVFLFDNLIKVGNEVATIERTEEKIIWPNN